VAEFVMPAQAGFQSGEIAEKHRDIFPQISPGPFFKEGNFFLL
jgi:hypothetical protein